MSNYQIDFTSMIIDATIRNNYIKLLENAKDKTEIETGYQSR